MTHIGEPEDLTHDDLQVLAERLQQEDLPVVFAYDTMLVDV
jgi:hypothetical protein